MIPPKALVAQWQSTSLNSGLQGWHGRVKPLQQDKGRCHAQAPTAAGGKGRNGHQKAPELLVPTTSHTAASALGRGRAVSWPRCPHQGLGHLGAITVQGGDICTHPPAIALLSAD